MPLTKSFADLISIRAASDPDFADALRQQNTEPNPAPLTMRDVLRLIWQAAKYPIRGNGDVRLAERKDAEALARAATAVQGADDAPEFAEWIASLLNRDLPDDEREEILSAIYDVFDPDRP